MIRLWRPWFGLAAVLGVALAAACSSSHPPDVVQRDDAGGGAGGVGGKDASADALVEDAPAPDAGDGGLPDAPVGTVRVGIEPTAPPGAGPTEELQAQLDVLAAGSRGIPLLRRWSELYTTSTQADAQVWARLAGTAELVRNAQRRALLCLAVVDRAVDERPAGLGTSWNAPATLSAVDALIDNAYATFGDELAYLAFGTGVDRYLEKLSVAERPAFVAFLLHALDYAKKHASKPAGAQVGVTATSDGIMDGPSTELSELLAASDVAIVTYTPVDSSFSARPPSTAPGDLDAMEGALVADGGAPVPVVLQEVAYPSAAEAGSSEEKQKTFFDGLSQALLARRAHHPFVGIRALHDGEQSSCEAEAVALGAPGNAAAVALSCSLGLRRADGTPKPALSSVYQALATFATP